MSVVKWVSPHSLFDKKDDLVREIPVIELSALTELVEGLKYIEAILCERKLCGHFTAEEIRQETQRMLTQLGAHMEEGRDG